MRYTSGNDSPNAECLLIDKALFDRMRSLDYHPDLLRMVMKEMKSGILMANFIGVCLYIVVMYPYIPGMLLGGWAFMLSVFLLLRIRISGRILAKLDDNAPDLKQWLRYYMFATLGNAVFWGLSSWLTVLYAPSQYTFFIMAILLTLTAGANSTLGAIYHIYATYAVPILVLLSTSLLFTGEEVYTVISFIVTLAMIIIMANGYLYYQKVRQILALHDQLRELNITLEERVRDEVAKNTEKDIILMHQARLAQMGEMISMIAHQWRQPLNIISAAATDLDLSISFGTVDDKKCRSNIEKINQLTQYLSNTIDDFRTFFKTEKDHTESCMDIIVEETLQIIGEYVQNRKIRIETDLNSRDPFMTYPNEIKQVLLNLLNNAEDALLHNAVENPKITIRTETRPETIELLLCDNGGGIPETILPKIFDAYFTTKTERNGTGLGLYMSKMIIEEHCEGTLRAYNGDEGACFAISLPRRKEDCEIEGQLEDIY